MRALVLAVALLVPLSAVAYPRCVEVPNGTNVSAAPGRDGPDGGSIRGGEITVRPSKKKHWLTVCGSCGVIVVRDDAGTIVEARGADCDH